MRVRIALVHAEQVGREQRRLVPARAGTDLEDDVPTLERVRRDQCTPQRFLDGWNLLLEAIDLCEGHVLHLGVLEKLARFLEFLSTPLQFLPLLDNRHQMGPFTCDLTQTRRRLGDLGIHQVGIEFLEPSHRLVEIPEHRLSRKAFSRHRSGAKCGSCIQSRP